MLSGEPGGTFLGGAVPLGPLNPQPVITSDSRRWNLCPRCLLHRVRDVINAGLTIRYYFDDNHREPERFISLIS